MSAESWKHCNQIDLIEMLPVSVKGVLLVVSKAVLPRNEGGEFGLHAVADLDNVVLPAGYARSIKSRSMHAES